MIRLEALFKELAECGYFFVRLCYRYTVLCTVTNSWFISDWFKLVGCRRTFRKAVAHRCTYRWAIFFIKEYWLVICRKSWINMDNNHFTGFISHDKVVMMSNWRNYCTMVIFGMTIYQLIIITIWNGFISNFLNKPRTLIKISFITSYKKIIVLIRILFNSRTSNLNIKKRDKIEIS